MKRAMVFMASVVTTEAFVPSSFAGSALTMRRGARSSLTMAEENPALATFDSLEKEVATAGGGFWFGSAGFWGEEDYRGFVDSYKPDNLINGVYPIVDRVRDTKILTTTSESGLLSALEDAGLTLSEAEKLLPALEEGGLLDFLADNLDVLINLFGFLAVEPAKIAIPIVVSVVKALKGAGLLKLGSDGATPALATASVSAPAAPFSASDLKAITSKAASKAKAAADRPRSAAAAIPKAAANIPKVAASKSKVAASKSKAAASKVKVAAVSKVKVATAKVKDAAESIPEPKKPAPVKKLEKLAPRKRAVSAPKGNISNIPKAL